MSPFTCPRCGRTSHHPTDLAQGYCGACHAFTADPAQTITPTMIAAQRAGGTSLWPGIWTDRAGAMHFSVPMFLEACGWPDDEHHRALVQRIVREVMKEKAPGAKIIEQE